MEKVEKKRKWLYRKVPLNENIFLFLLLFVYLLIPVTIMHEIKTINSGNSQMLNNLFSISEFIYYPFKFFVVYLSSIFDSLGVLNVLLLILYPFIPTIITERLISFLGFFIKLAFKKTSF